MWKKNASENTRKGRTKARIDGREKQSDRVPRQSSSSDKPHDDFARSRRFKPISSGLLCERPPRKKGRNAAGKRKRNLGANAELCPNEDKWEIGNAALDAGARLGRQAHEEDK